MKRLFVNFAVLAFALGAATRVLAVPNLINYQGRLTDTSGQPQSGPVTLTFNVYSAATGGAPLWGPQVFANTPLVDGYFNVILGTDTGSRVVGTAFAQTAAAYLDIQVGANPPITPRQQILSAPYAIATDYTTNALKTAFTAVTRTLAYTMTGAEDVVYVDGSTAAFTLTLPSPVVPGTSPYYGEKVIVIKRIDGNLINAITISGVIDGAADWKLNTKGESYRIVRNGTEWKLLDHYTKTAWSPDEELDFSATTPIPPAKPNLANRPTDLIRWRRDGSDAIVYFNYRQTAAGTAGTGDYRIALSSGLLVDTSRVQTYGLRVATTAFGYALDSTIGGNLGTSNGLTGGSVIACDATHICICGIVGAAGYFFWGNVALQLSNTTVNVTGWARVPIAGWKD